MRIKKRQIYLVLMQSFALFASEQMMPQSDKEIIFVLDASCSMKSNDSNRLVIDSIAQLICTLPTNYRIGFIAYHTDVVVHQCRCRTLSNSCVIMYKTAEN